MTLPAGASLGPYKILAPIGAGGRGEVYRARDPRLGRDVAIKVLPAMLTGDPQRLRRFEVEARAAGALNHPNVLAVYDVGTHDGVPYVVSELLEGETLRERMGGSPLAQRKALDYATQVAKGLAVAHEKGIVHRDLKPENLFVTRDGRVKILDFGLAKLDRSGALPEGSTEAGSRDTETAPGTILGTVAYMSPEQVRGLPADHRSDIFSFGAILFEVLTGRRAFKAETAAETMTAILRQDPLERSGAESTPTLAPGVERVLPGGGHCLEKSPDERFQSARDLAFALEALSGLSEPSLVATRPPSRRQLARAAGAIALLAAAGGGLLAGKGFWERPPLSFKQLTFRFGSVNSARFAPDGQTIVYSAAWEGRGLELFTTRPESPESRPLAIKGARILSISASGEMALLLIPEGTGMGGPWPSLSFATPAGTLARVPLGGGVPREVLEDTLDADWAPNGTDLAVARWAGGKCRLEQGGATALNAVTLAGKRRLVARFPGLMGAYDVFPDGSVLMMRDNGRNSIFARAPGEETERNLSWHDSSTVTDISSDGRTLLFNETTFGGGPNYGI